MKRVLVLFSLLMLLTLSGCIFIEGRGVGKGGPPWWAPATGYRRKHVEVIHYPGSVIIVPYNGGKHHWHRY